MNVDAQNNANRIDTDIIAPLVLHVKTWKILNRFVRAMVKYTLLNVACWPIVLAQMKECI